jgi:DNA-binding response OmpR family regulator
MARVFIIDDNEAYTEILKDYLTDAGYDVIIGGGSGQALEMLSLD